LPNAKNAGGGKGRRELYAISLEDSMSNSYITAQSFVIIKPRQHFGDNPSFAYPLERFSSFLPALP
jgi:hypothetical protein